MLRARMWMLQAHKMEQLLRYYVERDSEALEECSGNGYVLHNFELVPRPTAMLRRARTRARMQEGHTHQPIAVPQ